jgi:hypothetical protein
MVRKPRRSTQELIDDALANATIDAGTYGDEAAVPEVQQKRGPGRPPPHDWTRIDAVFDFYRSGGQNIRKLLPQIDFIMFIRDWCRQENPGRELPHQKTLEKRLQGGQK